MTASSRRSGQCEREPAFIDLFAGCGGLSLGLMAAGLRGLFGIEKDRFAFRTLRSNLIDDKNLWRYDWPAWLSKRSRTVSSLTSNFERELRQLRGAVSLVAGGPPCQGFSFAGRRHQHDPRNRLFESYAEVVRQVRPAFVLLENVAGVDVAFGKRDRRANGASTKGGHTAAYSATIRSTLRQLGYTPFDRVVRCADHGVPQLRPRFIVIGVKNSLLQDAAPIDPFLILERNRRAFLEERRLPTDKPVTAKQAISDLEVRDRRRAVACEDRPSSKQIAYSHPRTNFQRLMHQGMNGDSPNSLRLINHSAETIARYRHILRTCRPGTKLSSEERAALGTKKMSIGTLHKDKPSYTVTSLPDDLLHYSDPRALTVRECARLQTFPDWFAFEGWYGVGGMTRRQLCPRYTQVANAVPPLLAEQLGMVILELERRLLPAG